MSKSDYRLERSSSGSRLAKLRDFAVGLLGMMILILIFLPLTCILVMGVSKSYASFVGKPYGWKEAMVDGALPLFIMIVASASVAYAKVCSPAFLARLGLIEAEGFVPALSACLTVGAALAVTNWMAGTGIAYRTGGWTKTGGSGTHAKLETSGSDECYVHLAYGVYTLFPDVQSHAATRVLRRSLPVVAENMTSYAPLYANSTNGFEEIGYQFVVDRGTQNTSVITTSEGLEDALLTLDICIKGGPCHSPRSARNDTSLSKRDDNGFWVSYSDWGNNVGYDSDWYNWHEDWKDAETFGYNNEFDAVEQYFPANQAQCYGYKNNFCYSGGHVF